MSVCILPWVDCQNCLNSFQPHNGIYQNQFLVFSSLAMVKYHMKHGLNPLFVVLTLFGHWMWWIMPHCKKCSFQPQQLNFFTGCVVPCNDEFSAKVDLSRAMEFFDFASKSFFWSLTLWSLPWMCGMSTCAVYVVLGIFV